MSNFLGAYITGLFDSSKSCKSGPTAHAMSSSAMTDYLIWSIHVDADGNLHYNGVELVNNGIVDAQTANCIKEVIVQGRNAGRLERVWLSIGSGGGPTDFTHIDNILNGGGEKQTNLLNNFKVIADYFELYGFDYDNEDQIGNIPVIVNLTVALYHQNPNYRFSFCPYGYSAGAAPYWISCLQGIYSHLGTQPVEGFNLQCYAGGSNSDPDGWVSMVEGSHGTGITNAGALIRPGLAVLGSQSYPPYSPSDMTRNLHSWGSRGGWIWNTENVFNNGNNPTIADYANAIIAGTS